SEVSGGKRNACPSGLVPDHGIDRLDHREHKGGYNRIKLNSRSCVFLRLRIFSSLVPSAIHSQKSGRILSSDRRRPPQFRIRSELTNPQLQERPACLRREVRLHGYPLEVFAFARAADLLDMLRTADPVSQVSRQLYDVFDVADIGPLKVCQ